MTEETTIDIAPSRADQAMAIVKRNMLWSAGAGLIPIPMAELVAITAVEIKLIKELTDLYETPFRKDVAKSAVVALIGSLGTVSVGNMMAYGMLRFVPVIGLPFAFASVSAVAAGVTYAIGKVFTAHFETGGTLLDFDAEKMREHFRAEFAESVKAATAKATAPATAAAGQKA